MADDYDVLRDHISRVFPRFDELNKQLNKRLKTKNGLVLPNPPRDSRSSKTHIGLVVLRRVHSNT